MIDDEKESSSDPTITPRTENGLVPSIRIGKSSLHILVDIPSPLMIPHLDFKYFYTLDYRIELIKG